MRWILLGFLFWATAFSAIADDGESEPIIYLAKVERFQYTPEPEPYWIEEDGERMIVVSNGCGHIEIDFKILHSTKEFGDSLTIQESTGEWCRSPYDWPYFQYLIIAEGRPEKVVGVLNASEVFGYAYTTVSLESWSDEFRDWLGEDILEKMRPVPLEEPEKINAFDWPFLALEIFAYQNELTDEEREFSDSIIQIEGTDVTFLKAIKLSNIFPEMAED